MKKKNSALSTVDYETFSPYKIYPDGQTSLFPDSVAKSRGGVVGSVFRQQISERKPQEVNDVYEKNGQELPVQARVLIEYSQLEIVQGVDKGLNGFDWEVMDAISTLYSAPGALIDLDSIYRVIVGKKSMYPVTPTQHAMVNESIEKMRQIPIEIKIADLYELDSPINATLRKLGVRTGTIRNHVLPCSIQETNDQINGYRYGIRLQDAPPLFFYAKILGLASLYPLPLIDTPLTKTKDSILLQSFLLRSIDQMYRDRSNGNENPNYIRTEDVYSTPGKMKISDAEKMRSRKKVELLLDFWKKEDYIAGYETVCSSGRRTIMGYQVFLVDGIRNWDLPGEEAEVVLSAKDLPTSKMQDRPDKLAKRKPPSNKRIG